MWGIIPVPEAGYFLKPISSDKMLKSFRNKKDYHARKTSEANFTVAVLKTDIQAVKVQMNFSHMLSLGMKQVKKDGIFPVKGMTATIW